jgi:hypothetical protein
VKSFCPGGGVGGWGVVSTLAANNARGEPGGHEDGLLDGAEAAREDRVGIQHRGPPVLSALRANVGPVDLWVGHVEGHLRQLLRREERPCTPVSCCPKPKPNEAHGQQQDGGRRDVLPVTLRAYSFHSFSPAFSSERSPSSSAMSMVPSGPSSFPCCFCCCPSGCFPPDEAEEEAKRRGPSDEELNARSGEGRREGGGGPDGHPLAAVL